MNLLWIGKQGQGSATQAIVQSMSKDVMRLFTIWKVMA